MFHTYYIENELYDYYGIIWIVFKAENKKEALIKMNSKYPKSKIKIYEIFRLDKLEIKVFYD